MKEDREIRNQSEQDLDELRTFYNKTKRELAKISCDLEREMKAREDIYTLYQDSISKREEDKQMYQEQINKLRLNIDELEEENEDIKSKIQLKSKINVKVEEESIIELLYQ